MTYELRISSNTTFACGSKVLTNLLYSVFRRSAKNRIHVNIKHRLRRRTAMPRKSCN